MRTAPKSQSDCYQSAETAHKQAIVAVEAIHEQIAAAQAEDEALQAKKQKLAADLVIAVDARDAAKQRVLDRVVSISTLAPSILQPADVVAMAEQMQKLDAITRAVHQRGTRDGSVQADLLQQIMDGVADLLSAAPKSVFTESITSEPQAPVANGVVLASGGAGSNASTTAAPATPRNSVAALQAKIDTRERERAADAARETARVAAATAAATTAAAAATAAATRANTERTAEAPALQRLSLIPN